MTRDQISARVRLLIVDHQKATPRLPVVAFTEEAELVADLGFDSLDSLELTFAIEQAFDLEVSDDDAERFRSVGDLVDYLCKRVGEAVAA